MSGLQDERDAVDRLEEGVELLRGLRSWQNATTEMNNVPLRNVENARKLDQARARGDETLINELLQDRAKLEQQVILLQAQVLQLENERGLDGLTGVASRRRLDETLRQEWRRCGRAKDSLSLVFVDLDNFKKINDTHGHRAGDALLVGVGQQLHRVMRRAGDLVGRYGGDEFVILLPATEVEEAAGVAQKVQDAFAKMEVQYGKLVLRGAASIGVASVQPYKKGESVEVLIERADKAVYTAKHLGRNRIIASVVKDDGELAFANVSIAAEEEAPKLAAPKRAAARR